MTAFGEGDRVFDEEGYRAGTFHRGRFTGAVSVVFDDTPGVFELVDEEHRLVDESQRSISYGELADFTHSEQVRVLGWCLCEDCEPGEQPYEDCPKREEGGVFSR